MAPLAAQQAPQTPPPDPLLRARQLYNADKFDEAIAAAAEARLVPALANTASVIYARARLERYRQQPNPEDLTEAREALKRVDPSQLFYQDRIEFLIGQGVAVYLEGEADKLPDRYGAAADFFDAAMAHGDGLDSAARDRLFQWWALSLDRQAQFGPDTDKKATYQRIVQRADLERAGYDGASAMYWQVSASCSAGDLERAWNGAISAWVRAASLGPRGVTLRADLDRLMNDVVVPERAKGLTAPGGDARPTLETLKAQWAEHKKRWE
jgi:hypothetical protein